MVGDHGAHPVASFNAGPGEGPVGLGHAGVQLCPCHGNFDLVFPPENEGGSIVVSFQQVFSIVQFRIGEKAPSRHLVPVNEDPNSLRLGPDTAEIPQFRPKDFGIFRRKFKIST